MQNAAPSREAKKFERLNFLSTLSDGFGASLIRWLRAHPSLLLFGLIAIVLTFGLGDRPLANPDEGRYCEIPREMVASGDWVTPHLNGLKYFEKPPLVYWLQAGMIKYVGDSEFILRLVPMLFALLGCVITFLTASAWFGPRCGRIAASVLATSPLYYGLSRMIILDMVASVLISGAIFCMVSSLLAQKSAPQLTAPPLWRRPKTLLLTAYALCALATLAKGMIGFLIPGAVILGWIVWLRQWPLIARALSPMGIFVFLAIAAPWHVEVALRNPEFFEFYFLREHLLRLTTTVHARYQPAWFFIPVCVAGFFPWIAFVWQGLRQGLAARDTFETRVMRALMVNIAVVFGVYSLSQSKLIPYILPIFPAAAIVVARFFDRALTALQGRSPKETDLRHIRHALGGAAVLSIAIIAAAWYGIHDAKHLQKLALERPIAVLSVTLILPLIWAWASLRRRHVQSVILSLCFGTVVFLVTLNHYSGLIQKPSTKELALEIRSIQRDDGASRIVTYRNYSQDLPFYLQDRVTIVDWEGELEFGHRQQPDCAWMINTAQFWTLWHPTGQATNTPLFVVVADGQWPTFLKELEATSLQHPQTAQKAKVLKRVHGYRLVGYDNAR